MTRHLLKTRIFNSRVLSVTLLFVVLALLGSTLIPRLIYAQFPQKPKFNPADILDYWQIRNTNLFLISGAGSNVTAQIGRDGVVLVDSGSAEAADKVLATVKFLQEVMNKPEQPLGFSSETRSEITFNTQEPPKPIRWIINTTFGVDHIGGNEKLSSSGDTVSGGNVGNFAPTGSAIISRQELLQRLSDNPPGGTTGGPVPFGMLPTDTFHDAQLRFSNFTNGDGILLYHAPNAITDGDLIAHFRRSDVLMVGDIFRQDSYPNIDVAKGGTINGEVAALERILDLSVPEFREEGGTMIVPGHGRLSDAGDVAYYRDMCAIIRDRVVNMKFIKNMTLQQVLAAKEVSGDYDPRWARVAGTREAFLTAVYNTVQRPQ